ncbi:MAG TPA: thiamine phosphate synthase [Virgibacillus sp.]|nr:thiamine phosphate synthase [Virgibacillus sp.]
MIEIGARGILELHIISTQRQSPDTIIQILEVIHPYLGFVHLREKSWSDYTMQGTIQTLLSRGVPRDKLIVNNRMELAQEMKTGGVHMPYRNRDALDIESTHLLRTGCSVHALHEVKQVEEQGVDYLMYGHIFPSDSKKDVPPRGVKKLQAVVQSTSLPVIAIGGVTVENTAKVIATGAKGIAVLSGVLLARDPLNEVQRYKNELDKQEDL